MPDLLADLAPMRTALPFTTPDWDVVSANNGVIKFNARPLRPVDALDLSAALTRAADRNPLPFTTRAGDTVCISRGVIYLNARPLCPDTAHSMSAALARAVHETAHTNHTNQQEADHG